MNIFIAEFNSSLIQSKIVGGQVVNFEDFRYVVSIKKGGLEGKHFCCGCLLTKTHVLTGGYCILRIKEIRRKEKGKVVVVFGSLSLHEGGIAHFIKKLTPNALYKGKGDDIGLITVGF